jgi:hypothetical protein
VTLVDTPGTGAVVSEHQARTAEYMRLAGQLRERHERETVEIGEKSDAIIYLIGAVARATGRDFLEEFGQATGGKSRALNAIGVMAKIDLSPDVMARREGLCAKVADQLKDALNRVMPVSAGLQRALECLMAENNAGLRHLMDALRRIPPATLQMMLDNSELFRDFDFDDCPLSTAERRALVGSLDWSVFTTIARLAADPARDLAGVAAELTRIAGFGPLGRVLESHFLKRSEFLRAYRILSDARRLIGAIRHDHLPALRQREREDAARRERFLGFIARAGGDREVARELAEWVERTAVPYVGPVTEAVEAVEAVDRALGGAYHTLEAYNADFEALQILEQHAEEFEDAELDELRRLLGLYGLQTPERLPADWAGDSDAVAERQQHWRAVGDYARLPAKRAVAERAHDRLGLILKELDKPGP